MCTGKGYYCPHISDKDRSAKHNHQNTDKFKTVAQANKILNRRPEVSILGLLYDHLMTQYHVEASDKVLNIVLWQVLMIFQSTFFLPST